MSEKNSEEVKEKSFFEKRLGGGRASLIMIIGTLMLYLGFLFRYEIAVLVGTTICVILCIIPLIDEFMSSH